MIRPPYHYARPNCVQSKKDPSSRRRLISNECEALHELPKGYTAGLMQRISDPEELERRRQSLIGNGWHISVILFILQIFIKPLVAQSTISVVEYSAIYNPAGVREHSDFLREAVPRSVLSLYDECITSLAVVLEDMYWACPLMCGVLYGDCLRYFAVLMSLKCMLQGLLLQLVGCR